MTTINSFMRDAVMRWKNSRTIRSPTLNKSHFPAFVTVRMTYALEPFRHKNIKNSPVFACQYECGEWRIGASVCCRRLWLVDRGQWCTTMSVHASPCTSADTTTYTPMCEKLFLHFSFPVTWSYDLLTSLVTSVRRYVWIFCKPFLEIWIFGNPPSSVGLQLAVDPKMYFL